MAAARYKMISIPEALDTVLQHTPVLGSETVPLQAALGRILAATVTAKDALPPFPASIKVCFGYMCVKLHGCCHLPCQAHARRGRMIRGLHMPGCLALHITTTCILPTPCVCRYTSKQQDTVTLHFALACRMAMQWCPQMARESTQW